VFESVDEVGHLAHIGNLWIIRQQLEHFLYPKAKLELAREKLTVQQRGLHPNIV
jgi:hypothetical protein